MFEMPKSPTKILFIDNDEASFQMRQCIANTLRELPPVELFHATDATEGLVMLETLQPDVIVLDNELEEERELFIDSLTADHPPVLLQKEIDKQAEEDSELKDENISYIPKDETLEGIHELLVLATNAVIDSAEISPTEILH